MRPSFEKKDKLETENKHLKECQMERHLPGHNWSLPLIEKGKEKRKMWYLGQGRQKLKGDDERDSRWTLWDFVGQDAQQKQL